MIDLDLLNRQFAIPDRLHFSRGRGGLPVAVVETEQASAVISVYAAQVLSYTSCGMADDLLFVSERANFADGKAIKGGIPICWPWFGPDPAPDADHAARPAHGFVRNRFWTVTGAVEAGNGDIVVSLAQADDEQTRALWPHRFALSLTVTIGRSLGLALQTRNTGSETFTVTQALHTYFSVAAIDAVSVSGLDGRRYLDKVDGGQEKTQSGLVTVGSEVDRIYLDAGRDLVIDDPGRQRQIHIASTGSQTAVVWNPWQAVAAAMPDLDADAYRRFICVETANAASDAIAVAPGDSHCLTAHYRVESRP